MYFEFHVTLLPLQEIYAILTATSQHATWLSHSTHIRPPNGSVILYDRDTEGLNYRRDGYVWKKRKDGKHAREDHMRLRVKGADVSMKMLNRMRQLG